VSVSAEAFEESTGNQEGERRKCRRKEIRDNGI
jgi:hypothetical protein